jgi:hypothetical protein
MSLTDVASCVNRAIVGPVERAVLSIESEASARVTRSWLQNVRMRLSTSLAVGALVVVALINDTVRRS